jgi:hypothetical protein
MTREPERRSRTGDRPGEGAIRSHDTVLGTHNRARRADYGCRSPWDVRLHTDLWNPWRAMLPVGLIGLSTELTRYVEAVEDVVAANLRSVVR